MAQTQVSKEAIWLTRLLAEIDIGFRLPKAPVIIKADNQGAIAVTKDPRFHSRTKHIDIQWHFVRDQVETGLVKFEWVPTGDIAADGLTKALTNDKFTSLVRQIGLKEAKEQSYECGLCGSIAISTTCSPSFELCGSGGFQPIRWSCSYAISLKSQRLGK